MPDTYRVTTDQGSYNVTVDNSGQSASPVSARQMMGMMGQHEKGELGTSEGPPSLIQRLKQLTNEVSLTNPEQPQVVPELSGIASPIGLLKRLLPFAVGGGATAEKGADTIAPAIGATGQGLSAAGRAFRGPSRYVGLWEAFNNPAKAAATVGAPYAAEAAGSGLQKISDLLRNAAPEVAPKLHLTVMDVRRIRAMMDQGISQDEAVQATVGLKGR